MRTAGKKRKALTYALFGKHKAENTPDNIKTLVSFSRTPFPEVIEIANTSKASYNSLKDSHTLLSCLTHPKVNDSSNILVLQIAGSSSELSPQSFCPSHFHKLRMHLLFAQVKSLGGHVLLPACIRQDLSLVIKKNSNNNNTYVSQRDLCVCNRIILGQSIVGQIFIPPPP